MKLTVGSTSIAITSCEQLRNHKKGFFLEIVIPKESIGMDALLALLDGCEEAIVVTRDDGTECTYEGFKEVGTFSLDTESNEYRVWQVATSELEAQVEVWKNKVSEQNQVIANQNAVIEAQQEEIIMLSDTILEVLMG